MGMPPKSVTRSGKNRSHHAARYTQITLIMLAMTRKYPAVSISVNSNIYPNSRLLFDVAEHSAHKSYTEKYDDYQPEIENAEHQLFRDQQQ